MLEVGEIQIQRSLHQDNQRLNRPVVSGRLAYSPGDDLYIISISGNIFELPCSISLERSIAEKYL